MSQIIDLGSINPGDTVTIINAAPRATQYDIAFGSAGAVSFTLIPGSQFTMTVGDRAPQINMDDASPPGIRVVTDADSTKRQR